MDISIDPRGTSDVYIDGTTSLCVDIEGSDNVERLRQCSLLAINVASRDVHEEEPIHRAEMREKKKNASRGWPRRDKKILRWLFNFRELTVYLPENKYVAWTCKIKDVLVANKTNYTELDTIIGRIVHVSRVYHFPNLSFYEQVERPNVEITQQKDN